MEFKSYSADDIEPTLISSFEFDPSLYTSYKVINHLNQPNLNDKHKSRQTVIKLSLTDSQKLLDKIGIKQIPADLDRCWWYENDKFCQGEKLPMGLFCKKCLNNQEAYAMAGRLIYNGGFKLIKLAASEIQKTRIEQENI